MSFGWSTGDLVIAIQLARALRERWKEAPKEYHSIRNATKNLDCLLQDLHYHVDGVTIPPSLARNLEDAASACRAVLEELRPVVEKNEGLQDGTGQLSLRHFRQRVAFSPEDARFMRNRLEPAVAQLQVAYQTIQSARLEGIQSSVARLVLSDDRAERLVVANWLSPSTFADHHSHHLSQRHPGTGSWLLDDGLFKAWVQQDDSVLLCPGIPGSGKTVQAATIIDHMQTQFDVAQEVAVTYFYCNFNRQGEQSYIQVLASLARQLMQGLPDIPLQVHDLYSRHATRATRASAEELYSLLLQLPVRYNRVFIVLDALDELEHTDGRLHRLLDALDKMIASPPHNVSLLLTTRFIPDIISLFESAPQLEIRARPHDVKTYLDGRIIDLPSFVRGKPNLQEEIKGKITTMTDGMFLLARLHLDSLRDKTTVRAMRTALSELPKGQDGLSRAYTQALHRIDQQMDGLRQLARTVIMWITYAKRELSTEELQEAVAIEAGMASIDPEDDVTEVSTMLSVCAGLVTLDEERNVIRLVHYTTQEYLTQAPWISDAHVLITRKCLAYLQMDAFTHGWCDDDTSFSTRITQHKLLDYVAKHWILHAMATQDSNLEDECIELLSLERIRQVTFQVTTARHEDVSFMPRVAGWTNWTFGSRNVSALHVTAYFGWLSLVRRLLSQGADAHQPDEWNQTPLLYAMSGNHKAISSFLVEQGTVPVNDEHPKGKWTVLTFAAQTGHISALQKLLTLPEVDVNHADWEGRTALHLAILSGNHEIVKCLLARPDVKTITDPDRDPTLLHLAAQGPSSEVLQLALSQPDVDINLVDHQGRSPLHKAVSHGLPHIVRQLLLQEGINARAKNNRGHTPLDMALFYKGVEFSEVADLLRDWEQAHPE